jgi:TonB family protein
MPRIGLALFLVFSLPAAAIDACSALNLIEIEATLRGPGVLVSFRPKTEADHVRTCAYAHVSQAGSFDDNLKRFQSEDPLTLIIRIADNIVKGVDLQKALKAEPGVSDTAVPGIGDGAILRSGEKSKMLVLASGSTLLTLTLQRQAVGERHEQDLITLAQEALATNFEGFKVAKYEVAERALANDKTAFEADPKNFVVFLVAMRKFDEARTYNMRAAAVSPDDVDLLYQQGFLDWNMTYVPRQETRARRGLTPLQPLEGPECNEVRAANREKVEEGIADLAKAIKLRPDFADAMAYLNLMYRERADIQCGDPAARASDLKTADGWVDKFTATKRADVGKNSYVRALPLSLPIPPPPPPLPDMGGGVPGGNPGGVIGGIIGSTPRPPNGAIPQRVRVSAGISEGLIIKQVQPVYPAVAKQARIQGQVVLKTEISKEGTIQSLELISGHPMLVPSAIDAVKQWLYQPYRLNGEPVAVETTVVVNFSLAAP